MSGLRKEGRRGDRRAFRPAANVGLEPRLLLSLARSANVLGMSVDQREAAAARREARRLPGAHGGQTADGGRSVLVSGRSGDTYQVAVTSTLQVPGAPEVTAGTVRARRLRNGRVGLIVEGTTQYSELTINPVVKSPVRGKAHHYAPGYAGAAKLLDVAYIEVTSGEIGAILGYRTAVLSGPIEVEGDAPVNRIAFTALNPGASITVGNDLNRLDVVDGINLTSGPGIVVGRDLNGLSVGQDLTLSNGASLLVGRDMGLIPQAANGTAPGIPGAASIGGNVTIGEGSRFAIARDLASRFFVNGNFDGASRVSVDGSAVGFTVLGTTTD